MEHANPEIVSRFNGRKVDNRRIHPALFELNAKGMGRLQNSNYIPEDNPLLEVEFGEESITDLTSDPGNLTLVAARRSGGGGGDGTAASPMVLPALLLALSQPRRHPGGRGRA